MFTRNLGKFDTLCRTAEVRFDGIMDIFQRGEIDDGFNGIEIRKFQNRFEFGFRAAELIMMDRILRAVHFLLFCAVFINGKTCFRSVRKIGKQNFFIRSVFVNLIADGDEVFFTQAVQLCEFVDFSAVTFDGKSDFQRGFHHQIDIFRADCLIERQDVCTCGDILFPCGNQKALA